MAICRWNLDVQNWNVAYIDTVRLKGYAVSCCYRCKYTGNPSGVQSPLSRSRMGVWDGPHTNSLCKASAYATERLQIDRGHNCEDELYWVVKRNGSRVRSCHRVLGFHIDVCVCQNPWPSSLYSISTWWASHDVSFGCDVMSRVVTFTIIAQQLNFLTKMKW